VDEATRTSRTEVGEEQNGRTPEQIRADIKQTREELGETVEQLAAKTDVKAHAKAKIDSVKQSHAPLIAAGVVAIAIVGVVLIRR
jgi:uncharacterized protein DUF3618